MCKVFLYIINFIIIIIFIVIFITFYILPDPRVHMYCIVHRTHTGLHTFAPVTRTRVTEFALIYFSSNSRFSSSLKF